MPSATYQIFEQAMRTRQQIACTYRGLPRIVCPIVLGHTGDKEKALTFQIGGESSSGLPPGGEWRCFWLSEVSLARTQDGEWKSGDAHSQPQGCVEDVDLDLNPNSPFNPNRKLDDEDTSAGNVVSLFGAGGGVMLPGPGTFSVDVVGVTSYQPAIEAAARARKDGARTLTIDAVLVLEDDNPHDANAVKVQIAGRTVGYLKRDIAIRYRADLEAAGAPRIVARCKARIVGGYDRGGGERATFGVKLDLPPFEAAP